MSDEDDDLVYVTESNDDESEIALVVRSKSGRKIGHAEFILKVEEYLNFIDPQMTQGEPLH